MEREGLKPINSQLTAVKTTPLPPVKVVGVAVYIKTVVGIKTDYDILISYNKGISGSKHRHGKPIIPPISVPQQIFLIQFKNECDSHILNIGIQMGIF